MVKSKPSCTPESNKLKNPNDGNKVKSSKPKKYRGKKPRNNPSLDLEAKTNIQGWCTNLEGYIFDLGPRASGKFAQKMKELEKYFRAMYSDRC